MSGNFQNTSGSRISHISGEQEFDHLCSGSLNTSFDFNQSIEALKNSELNISELLEAAKRIIRELPQLSDSSKEYQLDVAISSLSSLAQAHMQIGNCAVTAILVKGLASLGSGVTEDQSLSLIHI